MSNCNFMLPGGDRVSRDDQALIINFSGEREVLSTAHLNGGFRRDLTAVFNFCEVYGQKDEYCAMRGCTTEEHLNNIAREIGLPAEHVAGISTAAKMKYAAYSSEPFANFSVSALATAGIDVNGSRVGDPAEWHEQRGLFFQVQPGTINIILSINAHLSAGALARAMVTCSEAKVAVLQEVLAPSCFSSELATGSGTDGTIIISNPKAEAVLTHAGHHSKLGEYIGRVVKRTLKEALVAEYGFRAYARGRLTRRIRRFGITADLLWKRWQAELNEAGFAEKEFYDCYRAVDQDEAIIAPVTLYTHLLDLLQWRLIDPAEAIEEAIALAARLGDKLRLQERPAGLLTEPKRVGACLKACLSYLILNCIARQKGSHRSELYLDKAEKLCYDFFN